MNKQYLYEKLSKIIDKDDIKIDEPMKKHISFRVGGPADVLVRPRTEEQIGEILKVVKEENIPFLIIGNGSNLLVKDGGLRGLVIEIADNFNSVNVEGNIVEVQSGALLSSIGKEVLRNSLKGFEFATGIPGTIGGAVSMNAGAYGGEIKDIVKSVRVVDMEGNVSELSNEEMNFGYRHSYVTDNRCLVLSCKIELGSGNYDEIKAHIDDLTNRRTTKQPLELASAGSTFKRPEGHYASQLIDESGLRGLSLRGAQVSEKHCGFVVNLGNARAKDILDLIFVVKSTVFNKFGVMLEEEVKILGEDLED
ncbi:MAG: UDP-N-acetylmuramate dehydrogenase [Clostridioides sp.]|jgi:UDP-N-acetylmuramate dehydrogenase|nr:UDP-N-acetylmuramate dehydrogenase [Clostridioides sp.]